MEKIGKETTPEFDFDGAKLQEVLDDINKEITFFKLDKNRVSFDGESFIIDGKRMSSGELKAYAIVQDDKKEKELYPDNYVRGDK